MNNYVPSASYRYRDEIFIQYRVIDKKMQRNINEGGWKLVRVLTINEGKNTAIDRQMRADIKMVKKIIEEQLGEEQGDE